MDVQAVIEQAMKIKGKTSRQELAALHQWAIWAPDGAAVEVGALHGRSVTVWAEARRNRGEMYVVDDEWRDTLLGNLPDGTIGLRGLSWEVVDDLPPLAFCFIDADHGIDAFPKDLTMYAAKIVEGGVIAFHDYDENRPEFAVKRYVDAWQSMVQWARLEQVGSLVGFVRI